MSSSTVVSELTVRRPVYRQEELQRLCKYAKPQSKFSERFKERRRNMNALKVLKKSVPVIDWLPKYNWKRDFLSDIVAGVTVAVMHIPQGMAYAILANLPSIVGIYMAFFPVLVYFIFGTSRHNSMGTFAVVCMMTGKVVSTYSSTDAFLREQNSSNPVNEKEYTPIEVATALSFTVAVFQIGMYVLRLGIICSFMADSLISGFTCAAGVYVFTSQLKDLFGLTGVPQREGMFKLIFNYIDFFKYFNTVNVAALVVSGITILVLVLNNEFLRPRIAKKCPFPFPIEMLVVVSGTLVSMYMNLGEVYNIVTVGEIPVGLPGPTMPRLSLIPHILLDSFVITIVAYSISMSMALIFAKKIGYEVDANQELLAQGLGNLVGSFFSCMPFTASLSRSLIQQTVGGRTQLASLVSCLLLICILLWIGPFFEPLPRCVLASIIVVALKGMLMKVTDLKKFWKLDKIDACIWAVTFLSVVILSVEYGLLIGITVCLIRLLVITVRPYACKLSLVPGTEIYLDASRYTGTTEIEGIKILHYSGSLNFASRSYFCEKVYEITGINPRKELSKKSTNSIAEIEKVQSESYIGSTQRLSYSRNPLNGVKVISYGSTANIETIYYIILDFSALAHIDVAGVNTLENLIKDYWQIDIAVYLAGCFGPVLEVIKKCNLLDLKENHLFGIFPTIADAVQFARSRNESFTNLSWTTNGSHNCDENFMSRL